MPRKAKNFASFNWVGYSVFRQDYPQSIFDKVQYETWVEGLIWSPEKIAWDNEIARVGRSRHPQRQRDQPG
jgi:hypothetical protein